MPAASGTAFPATWRAGWSSPMPTVGATCNAASSGTATTGSDAVVSRMESRWRGPRPAPAASPQLLPRTSLQLSSLSSTCETCFGNVADPPLNEDASPNSRGAACARVTAPVAAASVPSVNAAERTPTGVALAAGGAATRASGADLPNEAFAPTEAAPTPGGAAARARGAASPGEAAAPPGAAPTPGEANPGNIRVVPPAASSVGARTAASDWQATVTALVAVTATMTAGARRSAPKCVVATSGLSAAEELPPAARATAWAAGPPTPTGTATSRAAPHPGGALGMTREAPRLEHGDGEAAGGSSAAGAEVATSSRAPRPAPAPGGAGTATP